MHTPCTGLVRGCYYLGCYLVVRLAARVAQRDGAWMIEGGGLGGFRGGWLAHLNQWLGAQWAGLSPWPSRAEARPRGGTAKTAL